jgi:hypothetical protein
MTKRKTMQSVFIKNLIKTIYFTVLQQLGGITEFNEIKKITL